MKTRNAALAAAAVVLVGGLGAMRASGRKPADEKPTSPTTATQELAIPVEAVAVRRGELVRTLEVTGSLKTDQDVKITAKISGRVAQVAAKEGDRVRAGQLLVALEETDLRMQADQARASLRAAEERLKQAQVGQSVRFAQTDAQVEQAEANLKAAQVRLQQLEANIRLTDASAKAQVARAESGLKAARDQLQIVREGARLQERRVADNAVEQARVNLESAKAKVERRRSLFKQGAVSREDLDEYEKQFKLAEAQYSSATQQRDLLKEGARSQDVRIAEEQVRQAEESLREAKAGLERTQVSQAELEAAREQVVQLTSAVKVAHANKAQYQIVPSEIAAARASVDEARARLRLAEEQISYTRILSPVDGVVSARAVNVGESISSMSVLFNVVALSSVYFEAQVPELSMRQVRPGLPVQVTIDSLSGKTLRGTVREMIPVASPQSKSFRVRIAVLDTETLPVGAFARGAIETGRLTDALLIPKECLQSMAGEYFVFVVTNGAVRRQSVQTGDADTQYVQVLSGLKEGDRVVTSGATTLTDGAQVKVVAETDA